jgi:predicted tellurium resistance membrane protein TerC
VDQLFTIENGVALLTLSALEIVLGIDNIVFISILAGRLPPEKRPAARRLGLAVALISRLALLATLNWLTGLTAPLFHLPVNPFLYKEGPPPDEAHLPLPISGKDLILFFGGLFLIAKATIEIHHKAEGHESAAGETPDPDRLKRAGASFVGVLAQVMVIDIVFSLDSVITAVGMARSLWVMSAAVVIAVGVMLIFVNLISNFVERHPSIKMLALAFLVLIGVMLVADSLGRHVEKGYVYFAMAFSLGVEMLNIRSRKAGRAVAAAGTRAPTADAP